MTAGVGFSSFGFGVLFMGGMYDLPPFPMGPVAFLCALVGAVLLARAVAEGGRS